jgi:6-phosphogluconolactonase (cycloisomerase 2 family)
MFSKRAYACLAFVVLLAVAGALLGCSSDELAHLLGGGFSNNPTTPKFLIAVDSNDGTDNVNVFPINAGTGVLGTPVAGSPFELGIPCGITVAVHPNGHFVYAADSSDGSIHQWDVNTTTGVPTDIAPKVINESGSFYLPSEGACFGNDPTHVLTITPNGKFLYASNNDAKVSAYSIGSNGALTHIGDIDLGARSTGAITATNSFVWVTDTDPATCPNGPGDATPEFVHAMSIGSTGALTFVNKATLTNVYCWLWSIAVSPDGKFVQVGDEGGNAQVYSFTVGTDGTLTQVGSQVVLTNSSDCRDIAFSPDGKFFYTSDDEGNTPATGATHAVTQNSDGSITELAASPFTPGDDGQIVVDLTGKFVYFGGNRFGLGVTGYTRDATTGALTLIPGSPFGTANNDVMGVGIVRVAP